ncbi:MAG: molecular chaperone TorD family protein [Rhodospirillales bacterium]
MASGFEAEFSVVEEERFRAHFYLLLSRLLGAPADTELLSLIQDLEGDDTAIGAAVSDLKKIAKTISVEQATEEYETLFIGVTKGELIPFKSYYLTGFLNEKPLAELREHMDELGIAKSDDVSEPEDHIAFLCEMMHGLIVGTFGKPLSLAEQSRFFDNHIANWAPKFFEELEVAESAHLFAPLGRIGKLFMEVEGEAFLIAA